MDRRARRARARGDAIVAVAATVAVAETVRRARGAQVSPGEERVFRWFNQRTDRVAAPAWVLMQTGSLAGVFVLAGAAAHRCGVRSAVVTASYGTAVWAGVKLVKPGVRRGRPEDHLDGVVVRGDRQSGLGYPSGHAAVALTLGLMAPRALGIVHRPLHDLAAVGVAAATGATRMYVGAHLPLDIVGGLAIGAVAARAGSRLQGLVVPCQGRAVLIAARESAPAGCRRRARGGGI